MKIESKKGVFALFILIGLFFIGQFYIDVGFAFKPYMFGGIILFLVLICSKNGYYSFDEIDRYLFVFIALMAIGMLFSKDFFSSLRYFAGTCLVAFLTLQYKIYFQRFVSREKLEKAIKWVGLVFGIASLIYYLVGFFSYNFNFFGNNISSYGVLIDRSTPRLITFASDDPNISFLCLSFFLCFYMCNLKSFSDYVGLGLFILLCMLTLSRAAYISMGVLFILYIFHNKKKSIFNKFFTIIAFGLIVAALLFVASAVVHIPILEIMSKRFDLGSSSMQTGSGRLILWENSIITFSNYPFLGIGINSSLTYNVQQYGTTIYVHNTYLDVLSEMGLFGFIAYIALLLVVLKQNIKNIKVSLFPYCFTITLLIQNFFLSTLIHEMFFVLLIFTSYYTCVRNSGSYSPAKAIQRDLNPKAYSFATIARLESE